MVYSNGEFFILLLIALFSYHFIARNNHQARFITLLGSSAMFYAWSGLRDSLVFTAVILITWFAAWSSKKWKDRKDGIIAVAIIVLVANLFYWKYAHWVQEVFISALGLSYRATFLKLTLPIGISFFTLQGIAYLVDIRNNKTSYIPFWRFVLFKSYFAQLVAGPIVRAEQFSDQLKILPRADHKIFTEGLILFVLGLFKKVVIADRMGYLFDIVFARPQDFSRATLVYGIIGYSMQIWADFSGYTDMGRGASKMLGIRLPKNFRAPYLSTSPSDFWKRWHITLSQWIRDYIYIPLGGSQNGLLKAMVVVLVTMCISGLWHGAATTFAVWGIYHGVLLIFERAYRGSLHPHFKKSPKYLSVPISIGVMYSLTLFGWLLFRSESFALVIVYLKGVLTAAGAQSLLYTSRDMYEFLIPVLLGFIIQFAEYYFDKYDEQIRERNFSKKISNLIIIPTCLLVIYLVFSLKSNQVTDGFIYFKF